MAQKLFICHADGGSLHTRLTFKANSLSEAICPTCGNRDFVTKAVTTHILLRDDAGPIPGAHGWRYKVACGSKDLIHNGQASSNGCVYTTDPRVANCEDCLKVSPVVEEE